MEGGHVGASLSPSAGAEARSPSLPARSFIIGVFCWRSLTLCLICDSLGCFDGAAQIRACVCVIVLLHTHTPLAVACHCFNCRKTPQRETSLAQMGFYTNASARFPKKKPLIFHGNR